MIEPLLSLFESYFDEKVTAWKAVKADGSDRQLFRLTGKERSVIGVLNADRAENTAFVTYSRHFYDHGLPVPELYTVDLDRGIYLEQDLGDFTLYRLLMGARKTNGPGVPAEIEALYRKTIAWLPRFQIQAGATIDYSVGFPRGAFDEQSIQWDLNYFKYYFLKLAGIPFNEQQLEDDFHALIKFLLQAPREFFLYRDFQSRNIMVRDGEPYFIDYQGGRKGALQYDVASLLFDAKADLPHDLRQALLDCYLEEANRLQPIDTTEFMATYPGYVLIRILQALGAYGFRGFFERKSHFLRSVPYAIRNLEYLLDNMPLGVNLSNLEAALHELVARPELRDFPREPERLTVRIQSFSYKRGLPVYRSEHAGGFVFDCRSLPNPGRLPEYSAQTGNDPEVIAFLEKREAVGQFFEETKALVSRAVADYIERDFKNLSVAFGCTGGQHRSVYMANRLAQFLQQFYPVAVEVTHREEKRWPDNHGAA